MAKQGEGHIRNNSSMTAFTPLTSICAYSGGKAAVSKFRELLAHTAHSHSTDIRVNAIGPTDTASIDRSPYPKVV